MLARLSLLLDNSIHTISDVEILLADMCVANYNVHENFKKEIVAVLDKLSELTEISENCNTLFSELVEDHNERKSENA